MYEAETLMPSGGGGEGGIGSSKRNEDWTVLRRLCVSERFEALCVKEVLIGRMSPLTGGVRSQRNNSPGDSGEQLRETLAEQTGGVIIYGRNLKEPHLSCSG